jgi:hypothetical protein
VRDVRRDVVCAVVGAVVAVVGVVVVARGAFETAVVGMGGVSTGLAAALRIGGSGIGIVG